MEMACNLKLKPGTDHESVINDILKNLNLNHRRNNRADQLSGGEKRRLSIALELVRFRLFIFCIIDVNVHIYNV